MKNPTSQKKAKENYWHVAISKNICAEIDKITFCFLIGNAAKILCVDRKWSGPAIDALGSYCI